MSRFGYLWILGATAAGLLGVSSLTVQASSVDAFSVLDVHASSGTISSVALAETLLAGSASNTHYTGTYSTIAFNNTGPGGHYTTAASYNFPGDVAGVDLNNFAVEASTVIHITAADVGAVYTFCVSSDDGFELDINGVAIGSAGLRGVTDSLMQYTFSTAGDYSVNLIYFEDSGGADLEFSAAKGAYTAWNSGFQLVGANGAVPEPGTLALAGLGLLGLLLCAWRKRK